MKLEDQVITIDQAIRLKELGIIGESIWCWVFPKNERMISSNKGLHHISLAKEIVHDNEGDEFDHEMVSAFSVAELGLMLPDLLETHLQYELVCIKEPDEWLCRYVRNNNMLDMHPSGLTGCATTETEARAEMLISLLDNNIITVEEVNHRLSSSSDK